MRVVSQNGLIDVPYDLTAFHVCGSCILMNMAGDTGKGTIMAEYINDEYALRAMEMMREAYSGSPVVFQNIEIPPESMGDMKKILNNCIIIDTKDAQQPRFERITEIVFQFPEDNEVDRGIKT